MPTQASDGLRPEYTFDYNVTGARSVAAEKAAQRVVAMPGQRHNPLLLATKTQGVRASHLMHAIGHAPVQGGEPVAAMSSEQWVYRVLEHARRPYSPDRASVIEPNHAVLVDDIQFYAAWPNTRDEFLGTFSALVQRGQQVVLTCTAPCLSQAVAALFERSLVVAIGQPDLETHCAILRSKADRMSMCLPLKTARNIAGQVAGYIRELKGRLNRLVFQQAGSAK